MEADFPDSFHKKPWAFVSAKGFQVEMLETDVLCMTDGKSPGWLDAVG